jgi:hypothetical protein
LAVIGALIVTIATMSPAFAGAGAGPSTSTTAPIPSTTSTSSTSTTSTPAPPTEADPVFEGVSTTLGVSDPSEFYPGSTNPPATFVMTVPMTAVTSVDYDFQAPDPGPGETGEESPSTEGGERVAFRGRSARADSNDSTLSADPSPSGSTTIDPPHPGPRTQGSAALAAATSPDDTESGVSLFWPVVLGLSCLLLLGGPVVSRRLRHPH